MNVLILGGTGAMGTHLVELLDGKATEIFVTSRSKHSDHGRIRYLQGNARDNGFLVEILKDSWDVIIDFMVYKTGEFKSRIDLLLGATSQYVFISSARVYSESDVPITENTPRLLDVSTDEVYLKTDEYALAKARQEDLLCDSGYRNWTVIRPSITFSETRLQLGVLEKESWLYRVLHGRSIVFSDDIADKLTAMTYGLDVAKGIASIVGNAKALGEIFQITSEEAFRWDEILELYLDVLETHLGARPKVVMTKKSSNLYISKYQVIYSRYFNRRFDNSKVKQFVDVDAFRKTEEGLRHCLGVFLKSPSFRGINWTLEAMNDRAAGEYTPLSEIPSLKLRIVYALERFRLSFVVKLLRKVRHLFH
ncbi:NAD-dependent epimerase/dehydratase family protein [Pseudodesulfovibrio methanolicus]|uniref:NAD-dependent epimerase/dehydratase family protein n=1 Tax=Pseudodesulfovibrio methanolicus TaxID=3126690 RepID=A0ABZ2ITC0_9BACT